MFWEVYLLGCVVYFSLPMLHKRSAKFKNHHRSITKARHNITTFFIHNTTGFIHKYKTLALLNDDFDSSSRQLGSGSHQGQGHPDPMMYTATMTLNHNLKKLNQTKLNFDSNINTEVLLFQILQKMARQGVPSKLSHRIRQTSFQISFPIERE